MSDKNGGPAFPSKRRIIKAGYATDEFEPVDGMTLLDYFAAKAMEALISSTAKSYYHNDMMHVAAPEYATAADISYKMAVAMLKAREQS